MRLLVVGRLSGQLATAVKMAMAHGAKVSHVERGDQATEQLRRGQGADLLMVDYRVDIAALIAANEAERIHVPVVACGVDADATDAANAIRAGAKEFIPLPPEADLIAAVLSAVADDDHLAARHQAVVDEDVDRLAHLAVQLQHRSLVQLQQLGHRHVRLAQHG